MSDKPLYEHILKGDCIAVLLNKISKPVLEVLKPASWPLQDDFDVALPETNSLATIVNSYIRSSERPRGGVAWPILIDGKASGLNISIHRPHRLFKSHSELKETELPLGDVLDYLALSGFIANNWTEDPYIRLNVASAMEGSIYQWALHHSDHTLKRTSCQTWRNDIKRTKDEVNVHPFANISFSELDKRVMNNPLRVLFDSGDAKLTILVLPENAIQLMDKDPEAYPKLAQLARDQHWPISAESKKAKKKEATEAPQEDPQEAPQEDPPAPEPWIEALTGNAHPTPATEVFDGLDDTAPRTIPAPDQPIEEDQPTETPF